MKKLLSVKFIIAYVISLSVIIVSFYFYNNRFIEDDFPKYEEAILQNEEINEYINDVVFFRDEESVNKTEGFRFADYFVSSNPTADFENLDDIEKLNIMQTIIETVRDESSNNSVAGGDFDCGKKNICSFNTFVISGEKDGNRTYYQISNVDLNEEVNYSMEVSYDENGDYNPRNVSNEKENITTTNSESTDNTPSIEVVEHKGTIDGDYIYVTGAVKNNSEFAYSFVEVKVTYFDKDGNVLDTETSFVNSSDSLLPNERKSFEIMTQMVGQKYPKYKVEVVDFNTDY
ncbi:FxLYD domain-containing protein [Bacillus weihaiensis]|uniref:Uncharacterized protein n=1 Tax=Bacillus weihaiensis TaxID=1547283 RepID=A0A1L3MU28_9BACI|nr:FxLYD domain-containing protein [Bacillus weihaiensis]APH05847.1 hypothetical protein A9C19_14505 [Bacillus weihaiensis]